MNRHQILFALLSLHTACVCLAQDSEDEKVYSKKDLRALLAESREQQEKKDDEYFAAVDARIDRELKKYNADLQAIKRETPQVRDDTFTSSIVKKRLYARKQLYDRFRGSFDKSDRSTIRSGTAHNSLIAVLGPLAHRRTLANVTGSRDFFPSTGSEHQVDRELIEQLNLISLYDEDPRSLKENEINVHWPVVIRDNWESDVSEIDRLIADFLQRRKDSRSLPHKDYKLAYERLMHALEILETKVNNAAYSVIQGSKDGAKFSELLRAKRLVGQQISKVDYLYRLPYRGERELELEESYSIEEFLELLYVRQLRIGEASEGSEEYNEQLFTSIQNYAVDVSLLEQEQEEIQRRIKQLEQEKETNAALKALDVIIPDVINSNQN